VVSPYTVDIGDAAQRAQSGATAQLYIAKFDVSCNVILLRQLGITKTSYALGVVVDSADNVFITGDYFGAIDFGGGVRVSPAPDGSSAGAMFLLKLDSSGNYLWDKTFAKAGPEAIAIDHNDQLTITGGAAKDADFGNGPLGIDGVFVARFDGTGRATMSHAYVTGGQSTDLATLALDPSGAIFVAGWTQTWIDFGLGRIATTGGSDADEGMFVAKLDADGNPLWNHGYGGIWFNSVTALMSDGNGGVVFAPRFFSPADFGAGHAYVPICSAQNTGDGALVKLDANGNFVWGRHFGCSSMFGLGRYPSGDFLASGWLRDSVDYGGITLTTGPQSNVGSAITTDVVYVRFRADGTPTWACEYGDFANQMGRNIVVLPSGEVRATGSYAGVLDFRFDGGALRAQPVAYPQPFFVSFTP
jgi:hypothetical protein